MKNIAEIATLRPSGAPRDDRVSRHCVLPQEARQSQKSFSIFGSSNSESNFHA
jgi:hypothetical protein